VGDDVREVLFARDEPGAQSVVTFDVPESFPAAEFDGLPCAVLTAAGQRNHYADRIEGRRYRVLLPAGDYRCLQIGVTTIARSAPFTVGPREGRPLTLETIERRYFELVVTVRDEEGRPLRGSGLNLGEDVGKRELRGVAGLEYGATDAWPQVLLVPRALLDRAPPPVLTMLALRPGFKCGVEPVFLRSGDHRPAVAVTLRRAKG
jgi:hypothetical protein